MKQDTEETPVIFRTFKDGEVIALFPTLPGSMAWPRDCLSYVHMGQHGIAYVGLMKATRPATPGEIHPLLSELTSLGYRVKLRARFHPGDAYRRRAEVERAP